MLIRLMLRTALVAALKNRTSVGPRVFDSSLSALSFGPNGQVTTDEREGPFIAVYTGEGALDGVSGHPSQVRLGASRCEVLIQFGVTQKMVATDPDTDESVLIGLGIRPLDEGLQMALDVIGREIFNELISPSSDWGHFVQRLVVKISEPRLEAGASSDSGVRLAAHQLSYLASLADEPLDAREGSIGAAYIALLNASNEPMHTEQRSLVEALLTGTLDDQEAARRKVGHALATWRAAGLGSLDHEDPALDTGTINVQGLTPVEVS